MNADDCARRLREIYDPRPGDEPSAGAVRWLDGDLASATGTLHVVAAGRRRGGGLAAIAIGPRSPRSATDLFLLGVARARADAILTTGRILRSEPATTHGFGAPGEEATALAAWRRRAVGKPRPPLSVVLTGSGEIDLAHPLLRTAARALVLTGRDGAARLGRRAAAAGIELLLRERPDVRDAIAYLRDDRGCATIAVEAGPSTVRALYEPPVAVDEVMLSIFEELALPPELDAGALPDERELEEMFAARSPRRIRDEASGRWSFRRLRRA